MALSIGQVINDRYRIVSLLGQGGFGAVYRVWDINLSRSCALKENFETSPEAQRQFEREATILASLSHPNLPRVTDHFTIPDQGQYLVMDYVEGQDLEQMAAAAGGKLPEEYALGWVGQICDALHYLHTQKPPIIHRDIKPANIKVTPEGVAMLVDFGIAKMYDPQKRTTVGARAVTPGFSPPEQYGQATTDPRSDVYSLGATLYALMTGRTPTDSLQRSIGKTMEGPRAVDSRITAETERVILRAMELSPEGRFQTAGDFKNLIVSASKPFKAAPIAQTSAVPAPTVAAYAADEAYTAAPPQPRKVSVLWIGLAGIIVMIILGWLAVSFLEGNPSPSPVPNTPTVIESAGQAPSPSSTSQPTEHTVPSPPPTEPGPTEQNPVSAPPVVNPPPERPTSARVLWDVSHGPRSGSSGTYDPSGVYAPLVELLAGASIHVENGSLGDMFNFQGLVIGSTSAERQSYSAEEASAIMDFVRQGGGLLILAEHSGYSNRVAAVANAFGVQSGLPPTLTSTSRLADHPIFQGVGSLDLYEAGTLQSSQAEAVAWEGGDAVVMVHTSLGGRVVIIGDSNLFDQRWLPNNQQFAMNVFRWITLLID